MSEAATPAPRRLIVRSAVRAEMLSIADEWRIQRKRIPRQMIADLEADFRRQIITRVMAELNHVKD